MNSFVICQHQRQIFLSRFDEKATKLGVGIRSYLSNRKTYKHFVYLSMKYHNSSMKRAIYFQCECRYPNKQARQYKNSIYQENLQSLERRAQIQSMARIPRTKPDGNECNIN